MSQPVNYKIQNNVLKINFGIFCFYDLEMFYNYLYITTSLMRKLAYRYRYLISGRNKIKKRAGLIRISLFIFLNC